MPKLIEFRNWDNGELFSINPDHILMVEPKHYIEDMTGLVKKECAVLTIKDPSFRITVTRNYNDTVALINGVEEEVTVVDMPSTCGLLTKEELDMLLKNENNEIE